jgi:hypothetical protein
MSFWISSPIRNSRDREDEFPSGRCRCNATTLAVRHALGAVGTSLAHYQRRLAIHPDRLNGTTAARTMALSGPTIANET